MAADNFELTLSAVPIPDLGEVECPADGATTKTIDLQMKDGVTDDNGSGETVLLEPKGSLLPLDKESFVVDGSGQGDFTVGPFASGQCGRLELLVYIDGFHYQTILIKVTG